MQVTLKIETYFIIDASFKNSTLSRMELLSLTVCKNSKNTCAFMSCLFHHRRYIRLERDSFEFIINVST